MHVHYLQRTHTLQQQQYMQGGGGTHVHRMRAHSGYRLWYCRQHCSTLSSLFSALRPSGDKEVQREEEERRDCPITIEKWMSGLYHIQLSSRLPHAKVKNALEMHTVYCMFWGWIQEDQLSDSATWCLRSVLGWLWLRSYSGSLINVPMLKCPWAFFAVGQWWTVME